MKVCTHKLLLNCTNQSGLSTIKTERPILQVLWSKGDTGTHIVRVQNIFNPGSLCSAKKVLLCPSGTDERTTINVIKEGARPFTTRASEKSKLLQATSSWEMRVDVGRSLQFQEVGHTAFRPDIVLWSAKDCKIILNELIVPWVEGCEEDHERKVLKYQY